MKSIVVVDSVMLGEDQLARLRKLGHLVVYDRPPADRTQLMIRISQAHVLLVSEAVLDRAMIEHAENLEMISLWSSGFDHVDVRAARERGIAVCHAPGCTTDAIAEHTIAVALYFLHKLGEADRHVRGGEYAWDRFITSELRAQTFGVIGLGRVGTQVAQRARLLGSKVLAHTRSPQKAEEVGAVAVDLETLLRQSDIITVNLSLVPETEFAIAAPQFELMSRQPIFINTARGKIVDQPALAEALRSGRVRAAALDVLHTEPPDPDDPLLKMSNVLLTPHCSSATLQGFEAQSDLCVQNVEAFFAGRPQNIVPV